jgi:hypothetical protein
MRATACPAPRAAFVAAVLAVTTVGAAALGGCGGRAGAASTTPATDADLLHAAVKQVTEVIVYDIFSPPQASRVYAYASVAAYEALRQGDTTYRTLAGQLNGLAPVPAPPAGDSVSHALAGVHAYMTVGASSLLARAQGLAAAPPSTSATRRRDVGARARPARGLGDTVARTSRVGRPRTASCRTRGMPKFS